MELTRTIRAVQWTGDNRAEVEEVAGEVIVSADHLVAVTLRQGPDGLEPKPMRAKVGEWIVNDGGDVSVKADSTFQEQYGTKE